MPFKVSMPMNSIFGGGLPAFAMVSFSTPSTKQRYPTLSTASMRTCMSPHFTLTSLTNGDIAYWLWYAVERPDPNELLGPSLEEAARALLLHDAGEQKRISVRIGEEVGVGL
eukprot:CAMPEP_0176072434 /NCGR_PEP_ID=MMETSP0120_2-20121206/36185_1 /TAXON_ID=160619 /ORGANISM="Kryptoperidinium foliaceum, Strain CCMP 1326" /LENGTH=111 /DNA_ID=CAMNT_0017406103 /DNA_START=134 /DNA_END=468 /DNA_ORIENTATION=+